MNTLVIFCFIFFVGFSVLQCAVTNSEESSTSTEVPQISEDESHNFVDPEDALNFMLDLNGDIRNGLSIECDKITFSMEQITNLGKSLQFLALDDNEMLQLKQLHSYLIYTNGVCDDLNDQMLHFAGENYDQLIASIPYNLTSEQILRFGSPSKLDWAVRVTEENFETIQSIFAKNETNFAIELAELKKLKISNEIIKLSTFTKEIQLGIEPLMDVTKIKNDFLKNIQEMAGDLEKHVKEVLKLDDLIGTINKCIEAIVNAQKGIPMELALSFIV